MKQMSFKEEFDEKAWLINEEKWSGLERPFQMAGVVNVKERRHDVERAKSCISVGDV